MIGLIAASAFGATQCTQKKEKTEEVTPLERRITALGRLTPKGGNVKLAVPAGVSGGIQIVTKWMVDEGDVISRGQTLAYLSSYQELSTAIESAEENLRLSKSLLPFLEISRDKAKKLLDR